MSVERRIAEWIEERGYPPEAMRKYGVTEPRVVIIGEDHITKRCGEEHLWLYTLLKPTQLLHECMGDMMYDPKTSRVTVGERNTRKARKHEKDFDDIINERNVYLHLSQHDYGCFLNSAFRTNLSFFVDYSSPISVPVLGCDLSEEEHRDLKKRTAILKNGTYIQYIFRELRMARRLLEEQTLSSFLLMIVGAGHIRDPRYDPCQTKSAIHLVLEEAAVSYVCLDQTKHPTYDQKEFIRSLKQQ